jgi:hypothetical protein
LSQTRNIEPERAERGFADAQSVGDSDNWFFPGFHGVMVDRYAP